MMTKATRKPAPDSAAKTGLTWALWDFVLNGSVDGVTGRRLPMAAMVVEVVVVVRKVTVGPVYTG
jgi:tryptophan synthase alpha subunit